jgi:hypothetical protein
MAAIHLEQWGPELRRAMMRVRPEFFAWSARKRERYGADLPEEDERRLHQSLMKELFGVKARSLEKRFKRRQDNSIP